MSTEKKAILKVAPLGQLGNQMLQIMLALALAERVPNLNLHYELSFWNLHSKPLIQALSNPIILKGQYVDFELLVSLISKGILRDIDFRALGFRMEHYLSRDTYNKIFPRPSEAATPSQFIDNNSLLIHVRGGDILDNCHPDYGPVPLSFYRQIIRKTGLKPVFMGQISDDYYSIMLRNWFPDAVFIPNQGPKEDFELIRAAKNIVLSSSTFSWLAAWLSDAESIHLPVLGFLNPRQRPDIDLLPFTDKRYSFYEFPVRNWEASESQIAELFSEDEDPGLVIRMSELSVEERLSEAKHVIKREARRYHQQLIVRSIFRRLFGIGGEVIMKLEKTATKT